MRRLVDVMLSVLVGLVLAPVAAAVAFALWCQSGSSVIFRQERAGRYGEPFTILKFCTMTPLLFPGQPDRDRITPLGRFLRASSLDEIPQLGNVLRGEMSLIGPRPTLPEQVVHYSDRQRLRLTVLPGLTGWAQVRGRNSLSWPERIELDIWYIAHRSPLLDLKILGLTLLRLVRPIGITAAGGENPGFPHPCGAPQATPEELRCPGHPAVSPGDRLATTPSRRVWWFQGEPASGTPVDGVPRRRARA